MTKSIVSYATNVSNDATFRTWGLTWSDNLTAMGLIKTTDTGQIDWGTVARPGGAKTSAGYEIRQFNDTLQATKPVYVRFEFGTGASTSNTALWVSVGFATDGAGNLSNQYNKSYDRIYMPSALASATAYDWYFSGDGSWIGVFESAQAGNCRWFFLERMHDTDGTDNGDGVLMFYGASGSNCYCHAISSSGGMTNPTMRLQAMPNIAYNVTVAASSAIRDKHAYMVAARYYGYGNLCTSKHVYAYYSTDFQALVATNIASWSDTSLSVFTTNKAPDTSWVYPASSSVCLAMRWE